MAFSFDTELLKKRRSGRYAPFGIIRIFTRCKMFLEKKDKKYSEFLKAGGGLSGVYDISDKKTLYLVPVYKNKKRY